MNVPLEKVPVCASLGPPLLLTPLVARMPTWPVEVKGQLCGRASVGDGLAATDLPSLS